jgi:uracil phosphoribosyltransferase
MLKHHYGPKVHILDSTYLNSILADLCHPDTYQPKINHLVRVLYSHLLSCVVDNEFAKEKFNLPTRMSAYHPDQPLTGERISKIQRVVCANLARAGTYPTHTCYELLHDVIDQSQLRQDHIFAARQTNANLEVTGTDLGSHKIGGDVKNTIVLVPDPMGATGNTILTTMNYYKHQVEGPYSKIIAMHLIVTPEYLKKVTVHCPDAIVYALRVDRGLSASEVLNSEPGMFWDKEVGLNSKDYIVPGAGGFGEIMNNSFV